MNSENIKPHLKISLLGDIVIPSLKITMDGFLDSYIIANWEAPLVESDQLTGRRKAGPSLKSQYIPEFLSERSIFCLANNHTMDYGEAGLFYTLNQCQEMKIATVGASKNMLEAKAALIWEKEGVKIGILNRCETQFGIATPTRCGVAALDATIYASIQELKSRVDIVIISVHGAAEMSPWPSPQWQDLFRSFIDAGATIVHGHHAHVPQGYEQYREGLIFYGLGNFLVDPAFWQKIPNTLWSWVVDLQLSKNGIEKYTVNPVVIRKAEGLMIERPQDTHFYQTYLERVNQPLSDRLLLTSLWQEFALRSYFKTNARWLGFQKGTIIDRLKRILYQISLRDERKDHLMWYHLFACESHREAIATALGILSGELEDLRTDQTKVLAHELMPWSML